MNKLSTFIIKNNMNFVWHLVLGLIIRIFIIFISQHYDNCSSGLRYTDIDYGVFTNAAEHMLDGDSPYVRPTYRYTPLLAVLLIPNVLFYNCWGKLLFSVFDLAIVIVIRKIISKSYANLNVCAFLWLYNPLSIVISTRGNADSISCFLVLIMLYAHMNNHYVLSSICFALSVHFRLYPIIYGLVFYLSIDSENNYTSIIKTLMYRLLPTRKKIKFLFVFIISIVTMTWPWYYLYGQTFLDESYLYHVNRLDARHNFSIYFYFNYLLCSSNKSLMVYNIITKLPRLIILVFISFRYSRTEDLPFCVFCLTFVMVIFNTVITSQYFVWIVSLLPIIYPFVNITFIEIINVVLIWSVPQIVWLWLAYCLEFLGINTFQLIWVESLMFFVANVKVLMTIIDYYNQSKSKKKL